MSNRSIKKNPFNHLQMEKGMSELIDHLESKNFATIEEANAYLEKFQGKKIGSLLKKTGTIKDKALDLVIEAQDSPPPKGIRLARKALEIDPDCVDAYNYLATQADNIEDAMNYYRKGITIGRELLGEDFFKENTGFFWGITRTRPFMRAKTSYAELLIMSGRFDEAIREFKELLVLNTNDNQGNRFLLAPLLLRQNYWRDYDELFKDFKDDSSTAWLYSRALYLYLKLGGVAKTLTVLRKAIGANPHVVDLLIGEKELPENLPQTYSLGSFEEAVVYINESIMAWNAHEKALYWLADYWQGHSEMD